MCLRLTTSALWFITKKKKSSKRLKLPTFDGPANLHRILFKTIHSPINTLIKKLSYATHILIRLK